jgi:hypothetical protein
LYHYTAYAERRSRTVWKKIVAMWITLRRTNRFVEEAIERRGALCAPVVLWKPLAFELCLQDFSWQANKAGLGQVRWTIDGRPKLLYWLRLSAIHAHPLDFDAQDALQVKQLGALILYKES